MTAEESNPRRSRRRWLPAAAAVVVLLVATAVMASTTAPFRRWVQSRVEQTLRGATGGKVDMGSFSYDLSKLQFTISNLTIHGLESPGEAPYLHVDRLFVDAKLVSVISRKIGLTAVVLDHPVIHIIVYADGHTNQPPPAPGPALAGGSPLQRLFDLQVSRAEVKNGLLLINDRPLPLDFAAHDLRAVLNYVAQPAHYSGSMDAGRLETSYAALQPFASAASAAVNLYPNRAELTSFHWSSGPSTLDAKGNLTNFAQPQITLDYRGRFDVGQFAPIARVPEAKRGTLSVEGTATSSGATYTAGGKVQFADAELSVAGMRMVGIGGGAEYRVDPSTATLKNIFARVFAGTVTGDAVVRDWALTERSSSAHLTAHALSLPAIAAAVPPSAFSLRQMRPAGAVSGRIDATWKFAASLPAAEMALTITPPARLVDGELPVAGTVAVAYTGATGVIAVHHLDVTSRSLHLTASGTASPRSSQLAFDVTAARLHDFDPVLAALHLHSAFPPGVAARARFNGVLTGTLKAPVVTGQVRASDLIIPLPGNRGEARFDALTADAHYSSTEVALHNGILRRGDQQARFDVSLGLVRGQVVDASPLSARAFARSLPLSDLLTLAGYQLPITGTLDGAATLGGTRGAPSGSATVRITDAVAYGEPIRSAAADLTVAGHEVQASHIVIDHNGAQVTGNADYNLQSTAFRFDLRGSNFNLASLRQLQTARFRTSGQMSFAVQGSGSRDRPSINGTLEVANWVLNGEAAGTLQLKAVTSGDVLRLTGSTGFRTAELTLDGTVRLRENFPVNLTVRFVRLDFDPLLTAYTEAKVTGHSSADGTVTLTGPLRQPDLLVLTGNIPQFSAGLEGLRLTNDGPIQFTVNHEVFQLAQFRLVGADTHLNASGTIALQRGGALDLRSEGGINLGLLHTFNANLHSGGQASFQLQFRGTLTRPVLLGQMTITKGDLAYINFPNGLSNINGTLVFNQDRVQVDKLTAETGGGAISLGGFVSYGQTLGFNLSAKGSGIRLRYPAGVSTAADADLLLTGTARNLLLSGTLTVMRFSTGPQFDLATVLARARQSSQVPNPNSPMADLHFDLHIVSTPELQVQMSAAKLSGNMDVHLRGTADRPIILGRVDITEGQVSFNGTRYTIERGDVTFTNPVRVEPVLDVEVTTRVRDYDIALGFHGPLDRLSTTYRSDPPLPTTDIIALLAFGTTRQESAIVSEANPSFTESASNAILGQALNSASTNRVQKLFGVSRIKISPELEGANTDTTNPTAQVTIEQQVSRNITVTYITDLSRSAQQVIQMEYAINRNFSVIALRDQNGVLSVDFRYRQRKR